MTEAIRFAIAGVGLVGRRHVQAIRQLKNVELDSVVDPSPAGKQYALDRGLQWFATLTEMFSAQSPDGVILATPTPLHVEQGLECVANKTAVLIEKPLATSAEDASALVRDADAAGVPLLVGHHRRYNPIIRKAHEMITAGAIGDIRSVHSNCWFYKPDDYFDEAPWRKEKGAGPISVNLVHDVDLIRHLCGEVATVYASAAPSKRGFENEDVAAAVLTFANGAIGTITVSDSIVSPWSWELTAREYPIYPATNQSCYMLGGSEGSLSVPDLTLWSNQDERDWWKPISATTAPREFSDPLMNQIEHFAEVLRGKAEPIVSGVEGLKTLKVVEAIQDSASTGRTIEIE
jgi:predicted dehydrogenase